MWVVVTKKEAELKMDDTLFESTTRPSCQISGENQRHISFLGENLSYIDALALLLCY